MSKLSIYGVVFLLFFTVVIGLLTDNNDFEGTKPETLIVEEHLETEEVDELDEVAITTNAETPVARDTESVATDSTLYRVLRVIDGDTIMIDRDGIAERVRMVGIDTPETVHPSKSVECFGREASDKTKSWLEGRRVRLVADSIEGERDKYQRLLGYVYRDDGLFINLELIRQGYAYEYTYNTSYDYQAEFKAAQVEAEISGRGLWAEGVCSN